MTGGQSATTAPASAATAPPAGAGRGAPSPTAPGTSASAPPTGSGGPSPSAGGGSAAPSANAETTVLGTASMAGGSVASEISVLPGPDDENGKKTVIVVRKLTNNSSAPIQADVYSEWIVARLRELPVRQGSRSSRYPPVVRNCSAGPGGHGRRGVHTGRFLASRNRAL